MGIGGPALEKYHAGRAGPYGPVPGRFRQRWRGPRGESPTLRQLGPGFGEVVCMVEESVRRALPVRGAAFARTAPATSRLLARVSKWYFVREVWVVNETLANLIPFLRDLDSFQWNDPTWSRF